MWQNVFVNKISKIFKSEKRFTVGRLQTRNLEVRVGQDPPKSDSIDRPLGNSIGVLISKFEKMKKH